MGRDFVIVPENPYMPDYPDIVPSHPDWTEEDYERHITEELERVEDLEWPPEI